jgi:hypothetical protein
MTALAKTDRATAETRSLISHSLDVAHCVHAMLTRGVCRERLSMAAGIVLTNVHAARLAVLSGIHDMGKATSGFQDRIHGRGRGTGHVTEAIAVVNAQGGLPDAVRSALRTEIINEWFDDPENVFAAERGRLTSGGTRSWRADQGEVLLSLADEIIEMAAIWNVIARLA